MNIDIVNRIKKCIENALEHEVPELSFESRLQDDLGMESLQIVLLQVALEDEFSFSFDPLEDDFAMIFRSVGNVYNYVRDKDV